MAKKVDRDNNCSEQINVRLTKDQYAVFSEWAEAEDRKVGELARMLLRDAIEKRAAEIGDSRVQPAHYGASAARAGR